ncbi:MAG: UPF0158 family protein [Saprospiraceae bacterium]|nr:UPF0158 family protein [Saprospiraceae bacterium]
MNDKILEEIADALDRGFIVFVHRRTFEVLSYPDPARWSEMEALDEWVAIQDRLEAEDDHFVEVKPPSPKESFRFMSDFAEQQVADARLRQRLLEALNSPKPFKHFKHMVEDSEEADAWADYKLACLKAYAIERLAEHWD